MRRVLISFGFLAAVLMIASRFSVAQTPTPPALPPATPAVPAPAKTPIVTGDWTGTWGLYTPDAKPGTKPFALPITAKVTQKDGKWEAIFEGNAGGAYKYNIKMEGRAVGGVVMFKGTTDLGAAGGGVYDWIGRANDGEFVGFYTSSPYVGQFRLFRPGSPQAKMQSDGAKPASAGNTGK